MSSPPLRRADRPTAADRWPPLASLLWRGPEPSYPWLWSSLTRRRLRWIPLALLVLATGGLTGGAIALLINVHGVGGGYAVAIALLQGLPLILSVLWPISAWRLMTLGMLAGCYAQFGSGNSWPWPVTTCILYAFALVAVAMATDRARVAWVALLSIVVAVVPGFFAGMPLPVFFVASGAIVVMVLLGEALRGRARAEARLAVELDLRRQDLERHAVLEERSRIARELHDVVAHHMAVIALQAEAAPVKVPDLPQVTQETFVLIRESARTALTETRRVVGLLRQDDSGLEREPQPGLARLDELTDRARSTGLQVDVVVEGDVGAVPLALDVSAYRILQEALSNATRHAPGSHVRLAVSVEEDRLVLDVTNGPAASPAQPPDPQGGHGLVGMRERTDMLDGVLETGPTDDHGYRVHATLPRQEGAR